MHFEEILDQAIAMLQRRGRVTYRALKRQFNLDDAFLEDLTVELIKGQRLARDEDGEVLVWTGDAAPPAAPAPTPPPAAASAPLAYTPPYLVEKILTTRSAMEGERKQVTVLFADLKGSTELIRDLDPEAAQKLLDPALQRMMDAVHRFEGTVNQVLGDGIMALLAPLLPTRTTPCAPATPPSHICRRRATRWSRPSISGLPCARRSCLSGNLGRILASLREAESLAVALDDSRAAGTGLWPSVRPILTHGRI